MAVVPTQHSFQVVVLLLSVAVQSKTNEKIINDITLLDYEVQRDLMFFIETTLAKVKSHAIMAGTFTSGKDSEPSHWSTTWKFACI